MGERKEVTIDIGKTETDKTYQDDSNNNIKVEKVESPSGLSGYKRYTHTPLDKPHYITEVNHNGTRRNGLENISNYYYEKTATVYYLKYDESNALPLVVGLEKTSWNNKYDYYKITNPLTSNQWKDEDDRKVDQEHQLLPKLAEISAKLTELIVLNLTKNSGNYFANGESNEPPDANKTARVTVSPDGSVHTIYKKYKHTPSGGISAMRLLSTKSGGKNIPFESPIYRTGYSEASAYLWAGDSNHRNPLLLELKQTLGTSTYYTLTSDGVDKKWNNPGDINVSTLKDKLDQLNCEKNQAHIVDLSKQGSGTPYNCTGCSSNQVTVNNYPASEYSYFYHTSYSFSRFKDGETEQDIIDFPKGAGRVNVYWYPKDGGESRPLLIYFQYSSRCYQREAIDSSTWSEVSTGKPSSHDEESKILKLLKAILPTVTIDVGYKNSLETSKSSTSYEDPSEGDQKKEQIKVTINKLAEGFVGFTHYVKGKPDFMVKEIKHNDDTIPGISSNFILKTVTAYYSGTDFKPENLILVELEKRGTNRNKYEYYSRESGEPTANWTQDSSRESKLQDTGLLEKLKELKEKLEKEKSKRQEAENKSQGGVGADEGPGSGGLHDTFKTIFGFITSKPAEIGGVGGTIGTGIAAVTIWKWPKMMSLLIARL